jgi:hypothetical protein
MLAGVVVTAAYTAYVARTGTPPEPAQAVYLAELPDSQLFWWDSNRDEALVWTGYQGSQGSLSSGTAIDVTNMRQRSFTGIPYPMMSSRQSEDPPTPPALANAKVIYMDSFGIQDFGDGAVWLVDESDRVPLGKTRRRPMDEWRRDPWGWFLSLCGARKLAAIQNEDPKAVCVYTSNMEGGNLRQVAHIRMDVGALRGSPISPDRRWMLFAYQHQLYALPLR